MAPRSSRAAPRPDGRAGMSLRPIRMAAPVNGRGMLGLQGGSGTPIPPDASEDGGGRELSGEGEECRRDPGAFRTLQA